MPYKVYIASLYSRREEMVTFAEIIKGDGHEVTARWIYGGEEGSTVVGAALLDLEDVDMSDVVISFTQKYGASTPGGGRHVEFGYALARGKKMVLIGERENIFHHHPRVETYSDLNEWLRHVKIL